MRKLKLRKIPVTRFVIRVLIIPTIAVQLVAFVLYIAGFGRYVDDKTIFFQLFLQIILAGYELWFDEEKE